MNLKTLGALALLTAAATLPNVSQAAPHWHKWKKVDHGPSFEDASPLLDWERIDDPNNDHLSGAAWLDYDGDDDLDLFIPNGPGGDNALFQNDGGTFVNVAAAAGLTGEGSGFTGATAGDIDNDGCVDLFLTGAGGFLGFFQPSRLYANNCDGTFTDITAGSGISADHLSLMAAFGDIDNDGLLDLYVASPGDFLAIDLTPQKLYHNLGGGVFEDISVSAGIDTTDGGCVVGFSDFNEDGLQDLLMGNCGDLDETAEVPTLVPGPWEMWINQGDLTFVDVAQEAGLRERDGYPMAVTLADYDADGDLDIFSTGMGIDNPATPGLLGEQVLFSNNGDGTYSDATYSSGLGGYEFGWGGSFGDFDNDGDEDLFTVGTVANPLMPLLGEFGGPGRVFENDGAGNMTDIIDLGLENQATSGLAVADYDGDGFSDVAIVKTAFELETPGGVITGDGHPVLLHNEGNSNRSITVRLVGTTSNAMGVGARVRALTPDRVQTREVAAGSSFASTNSPWLTFGIGKWHLAFFVVEWPSGLDELFVGVAQGHMLTLEEGTGICL